MTFIKGQVRAYTQFRFKWHVCACGNGFRYSRICDKCEICSPDDHFPQHVASKYLSFNKNSILGLDKAKASGLNYQIDHVVPRWFCYKYDISDIEMSLVDNLQLISPEDNDIRGSKGSKLPEEWIDYITGKNWVYTVDGYVAKFQYLWHIQQAFKISYIKLAGALIKDLKTEVMLGGFTVRRTLNMS